MSKEYNFTKRKIIGLKSYKPGQLTITMSELGSHVTSGSILDLTGNAEADILEFVRLIKELNLSQRDLARLSQGRGLRLHYPQLGDLIEKASDLNNE